MALIAGGVQEYGASAPRQEIAMLRSGGKSSPFIWRQSLKVLRSTSAEDFPPCRSASNRYRHLIGQW
jgi:hypothetical protein